MSRTTRSEVLKSLDELHKHCTNSAGNLADWDASQEASNYGAAACVVNAIRHLCIIVDDATDEIIEELRKR